MIDKVGTSNFFFTKGRFRGFPDSRHFRNLLDRVRPARDFSRPSGVKRKGEGFQIATGSPLDYTHRKIKKGEKSSTPSRM
jgi:hypothetical protein